MKSRWQGFRSVLATEIEKFLEHKRALRRRYRNEEAVLRLLDAFLVKRSICGLEPIRSDVLEKFLASRPRTRPRSYNHLLGVVRRFFDWLVVQGRIERSPVRARRRRETAQRLPYILERSDAQRLLELASRLPDNARAVRRGPTYRTIFALLYGLGLRVGEVSRLRCRDVNLDRAILVVRGTKFGKDRLVPFGPRMSAMLHRYLKLSGDRPPDTPVFSFTDRRPIHPCTISHAFHHLVPRLGLNIPAGTATLRLHDLRHAFAVRTLLRWYQDGVDPSARLFHLSTFMGHVSPSSTAVYLTITPALQAAAAERFERFVAPLPREEST